MLIEIKNMMEGIIDKTLGRISKLRDIQTQPERKRKRQNEERRKLIGLHFQVSAYLSLIFYKP